MKFHKEDIPEFIDWLKAILAINSAGIGAIAFSFKAGAVVPTTFKVAVGFFIFSTLLLLQSLLIIIEHKRSSADDLPGWRAGVVVCSIILFLGGMVSVTVNIFG